MKPKLQLLEEFSKVSRGARNDFQGKPELVRQYRMAFEQHREMLLSDDIDILERGSRLFLNFLLLAENESYWETIMSLNILDQIFLLFGTNDTPLICEICVSILAELQYWRPISMNDDLAAKICDRCIELFSWGDPELDKSVLIFIQNLCSDYPRFSNLFLERGLFIEYYNFFLIDMKHRKSFLEQLGATTMAVLRNPFDEVHFSQVVPLLRQWMKYPYNVSIRQALDIIQMLCAKGISFPFQHDDVSLFEVWSASKDREIVVAAMKTLTCLKDDEFVERCLTETFLDNLAIQVFNGRKDDIVGYIYKFMMYIFPFTRPISSDLIVIVTCVSISRGRFCCKYYGLKFFRACCTGNDRFALEMCDIGICSLAAKPLTMLGESKIGSIAADVLMLVGAACERHGVDIANSFGYELVLDALAEVDRSNLTSDDEAKLHEIERYCHVI